jgi:hypothetical protein
LAPALSRFAAQEADIQDKKTAERAQIEAREDFERLREEKATFAQARKDGLVRRDQDPFYRKYYENTIGRLMAEDAYAQWLFTRKTELADATSLDQFDERLSAFTQSYLSENFGEDFGPPPEGFLTVFQARLAQDRQGFASQAAQNLLSFTFEGLHANASASTRNMVSEGREASEIGAYLGGLANEFIAAEGAAVTSVQKRMATQAVVTGLMQGLSVVAADPDVPQGTALLLATEVLEHLPTGPGAFAADTPSVQKILDDARVDISRAEVGAARAKEREIAEQVSGIITEARGALLEQGPDANLNPFIARMNALPTESQSQVNDALRDLFNTQFNMERIDQPESDPAWVNGFLSDVYSGAASVASLRKTLVSNIGVNITWQDAQRLEAELDEIVRESKEGRGQTGILKSLRAQQGMRMISEVMGRSAFGFEGDDKAQRALAANFAEIQYADMLLAWKRANPDASPQEQDDYAIEAAKAMLGTFFSGQMQGEEISGEALLNDARIPKLDITTQWDMGPRFGPGNRLFNAVFKFQKEREAGSFLPPSTELLRELADLGFTPNDLLDPGFDAVLKSQQRFYDPPGGGSRE